VVDPARWVGDPIKSLMHSPDAAMAVVQGLGHKVNFESGASALKYCAGVEVDSDDDSIAVIVNEDVPRYWTHQDRFSDFDTKEPVPAEMQEAIQRLLDQTFVATATRDRKDPMPTRLKLVSVHRIEDRAMWNRYAHKRSEIAAERECCTLLEQMEGSGHAKTMQALGINVRRRLKNDINELYLFHGTSPTGALGIREDGFNLSLAGSSAGCMFGPGAYFAEASSKSDEYARSDPSGIFQGLCALLLCRVTCGEMFYITTSDVPAIDEAVASGDFDSVLGDRERVRGTYREFVAFDSAQVYPEYVVIYERKYAA